LNFHAQQLLKKYFGYETFKPGQEAIINSILQGSDTLGIMPTGGGKSVCYQIPALLLPGLTIVISPLIALMKDQVDALNKVGIPATYINSTLYPEDINYRLYEIEQGKYKMLYIAPERLTADNGNWPHMEISMIAIDEAHCVSQWGHDFRPAYTMIAPWIEKLPTRPVVATFTATATEPVRRDIIQLLKLNSPGIFITGFDRPNLHFSVVKGMDKRKFIIKYVKGHQQQSGIIYAATRKEVDRIYEYLHTAGFAVGKYHAGMNNNDRTRNQEDFLYDKLQVMVATNAFGLGINKTNIRYIIHHNMPRHIEAYYQEAGRAGRDDQPGDCILLYAAGDIQTQKFLIEQSELTPPRKHHEYEKLQKMVDYCHSPRCLRQIILSYFGEEGIPDVCNNCANCSDDFVLQNITIEAQKIFSCIIRMGEQYGSSLVAAVLKGSKSKRIFQLGFENLSTYGIMADLTLNEINDLIKLLIAEDYLYTTEGKYPVVMLTAKAIPVLKSRAEIIIRMPQQPKAAEAETEIFEALRALRMEIAQKEGVPPYVIFHDSTLKEMSAQLPVDEMSMLTISGVGEIKLEKYGEQFIKLIQKYVNEKGLAGLQNATLQGESTRQKSDKTPSHIISWNLYHQGYSLQDIAAMRDVSLLTIEEHLLRSAQEGYVVNWDEFISQEDENTILAVINKMETIDKLKPIKEALPDEISYFTIKIVLHKIACSKQMLNQAGE
jgi:ATP-dependent DNA helicase RecQ